TRKENRKKGLTKTQRLNQNGTKPLKAEHPYTARTAKQQFTKKNKEMDYRKISASERLPELAPSTSPTAFRGCSEKVHTIVETSCGFIVRALACTIMMLKNGEQRAAEIK